MRRPAFVVTPDLCLGTFAALCTPYREFHPTVIPAPVIG